MNHKLVQDGHEWEMDNGAVIRVINVDWSRTGRLYANVQVLANDGVVGGGVTELSSVFERNRFAQDISSRNGAKPQIWEDALLSVYAALEETHGGEESFSPVVLGDFEQPEEIPDIVDGIVIDGETNNLFGDGGQGKSTVADYLAVCLSIGRPFLGRDTLQGDVLILDWELNQDRTLHRLYRLARGLGLDRPPKGIHYVSLLRPMASIITDVEAWCLGHQPKLVILDSYVGASGSDPMDQAAATKLMETLRRLPWSRLLVDHQANPIAGMPYRTKRAFGSSYKTHLARSSLQLEQVSSIPGRASVVLRQIKNNFGPKAPEIPFHMIFDGPEIRLELAGPGDIEFKDADALPAWQRVERFFLENGASTIEELAEGCGIEPKTVMNSVSKLRSMGRMPKTPDTNRDGNKIYDLLAPE